MIYKRIKTIDEIIEEKIKYMRYTGIKSIDERIGKKIEEANKRKYFVPRELHECNELIPEVEKIIKDYKDALKPWYRTSWSNAEDDARSAAWDVAKINVWDVAWYAAWEAARSAAKYVAFYATLSAARGVASDVAWYAAIDAAYSVAWDVAWELIRDIKGYENNPFEIIVKLYDMGLYPRGFRIVYGSERFFVDFPLPTNECGCWAEGENEILYKHKWGENCNERRPV